MPKDIMEICVTVYIREKGLMFGRMEIVILVNFVVATDTESVSTHSQMETFSMENIEMIQNMEKADTFMVIKYN